MKQFKLMSFLTMAALILAAPAVYANQEEGRHHKDHKGFYKDLNLTDAQKKELEATKKEGWTEAKATFKNIHAKREALHQELSKDTLDMAKIGQIQAELKDLQAKGIDQEINGMIAMKKVLTPEQFKKMMAKKEEMHDKFKHGRKGHHKEGTQSDEK
jgi:Spy/CpxP family protein refolding chaperone